MLDDNTQLDIMRESREALNQINKDKGSNLSLLEEAQRISKEKDMGRGLYDPYEALAFEGKLRVDMLYFGQMFKNLNEDQTQAVEEVMTAFFRNVKSIYEFVNIKPEIYGKGITVDLIDESMEATEKKINDVIFKNLDNNFYKLTQEQRKDKYYETSKHTIKSLMESGVEVEDAVKFGVKVAVLEGLIRNISFPFSCWARVQHLTEDVDYGRVFEQDKLIDLVESFEKKVYNIAKIVATCV